MSETTMQATTKLVKFIKKIGEGTFGVVYRVIYHGKDVAIKIEKTKGSMSNEINALKRLSHVTIPPLINLGIHNGLAFIIIPLYKASLAQIFVTHRSFFTEKTIVIICWYILDALQYIHSNNLVYRDLKPENIMLGFDGKIYLVDFGLCSEHNDTKKIGKIIGTPRYTSVATHRGLAPTFSDDFESLLYVTALMLTGTLPWITETSISKIRKQKETIGVEELFIKDDLWLMFGKYLFKNQLVEYRKLREILLQITSSKEKKRSRGYLEIFRCC